MTIFQYLNRFILASIVLAGIAACEKPLNSGEKKSETQNNTAELSLTVYKNAQCKCCNKWITHMQNVGFHINISEPDDLNVVKDRYGIQQKYQSCHTAVMEHSGAVFEGHIPAFLVKRFLKEKPVGAKGLSVPGMPIGSPGMEMGDRRDPYDVLLLMEDGSSSIYAHIDDRH